MYSVHLAIEDLSAQLLARKHAWVCWGPAVWTLVGPLLGGFWLAPPLYAFHATLLQCTRLDPRPSFTSGIFPGCLASLPTNWKVPIGLCFPGS